MELECDLSKINNEELLRKMWQQSEDICRKKEIRTQLYKLRESRLRDLYQGDIMADNTVAGFGKDPLATSHGDSLADQSFQSLKSKEVRDSLSPTEMKFQSMALNNPNNTGWNVQSSKEVSPDGRGFRAETIATTDGVENINGGIAEFKGRNEKHSSAHHQGDDKNFVKKAMESSNSHLQEKVVIGDENSGLTEVRTSSSTSTSSSQVVQSSTNVEYDDGFPIPQAQPQKYLMDSNRQYQQDLQQRQVQEEQRLRDEQRLYEQQFQQQRQHHLNQQERRTTEQSTTTRQNTEQKNISQNVQTQETHEKNKRYVDIDKASPEYQQHVQYLMQQPGEIISNTVEYPKPNVKMITTVKRLPDGTIVRNKRYETEEVTPVSTPTNRTAPNPTQVRRDSQQQPRQNYQPKSPSHPSQKPSEDMVDSGSTTRYVQDSLTDDVETKFSSVKKSSSKFSSETIQEYDHPQSYGEPSARPKPVTNDFSTHGFPSVRPNKPTQEYPTERPRHAQGYPSQAVPKTNEAVVPHYTDAVENISERRIPTKDGEVVIVSSEKKSNFKTQTNSERIIETEHDIRDDQHDFTTHGFPPVRELVEQPKMYPSERQIQPQEQDFPLDKMPPGSRIIKPIHTPYKQGDDETLVVSSQKSHTTKYNTNTERVIEHEIIRDDQSYPHTPSNTNNLPYTVNTPGDQVPYGEFPGSQRKPAQADFSTQGFPSVRSPNKTTPGDYNPQGDYYAAPKKPTGSDFSTQGFPSVRTPSKPAAGLPSQNVSTHGFPSVRSPTKTSPTQGYPVNGTNEPLRATPSSKTQPRASSPNKYKTPTSTTKETTERVIRKEKEVDSAHRAFAASLRSSSPIDHVRRDSYTTDSHSRQTPRSSVSSTKTFRRDMREGSHDSAPSETSRLSTTTVTRNTPPRNVGGRSVVTRVVTTKTGHGSNDSLSVTSPRSTKSPSPGKIVTTTTTTTRTLTKTPTPTRDVPKSTDNQHTRIIPTITSSIPINETLLQSKPQPPLTTITKIKFSENHKLQPHPNKPKPTTDKKSSKQKTKTKENSSLSPPLSPTAEAVVEEIIEKPCLKKNYYKLGPSDTLPIAKQKASTTITNRATVTSRPYKLSQTNEKSPVKKPSSSHQPQQAPRSRSSTPSYNNKNQITTTTTTVMADNDDDRSPLSPSFSSRKPQTVVTDKIPQDDWQTRKTVTDDERRTVIGDTTFEKSDKPLGPSEPSEMPRKPQYQQPNVEWVIVDNVDIEEHDADDDDFTTEVVDSKIENVKKTTRNLIINEKQTPTVPIKGQKAPITTEKNLKPQTKLNDKMPQQVRPQKSLPDSRSPPHVPSKSQPKTRDNNQLPKTSPKTPLAFNAPHLKKPATKVPSDASATVRTTLKTSAQIVKDTTTKLIEENKISGRLTKQPQSPLRKPKTEDIKKRSSNEKPIHRKGYPENVNEKVSTTIIETTKNLKRNSKSPVRQPETLQEIPRDMNEEPVYNEPNKPTQDVPASKTPNDEVPNYRSSSFPQNQLPVTESIEIPDDTQNPSTPKFKKPEPIPDYRKPQVGKLHDEPFATDVDELVTDDETHVTTANRTVARHIERFETNCLKDSSSTPFKGPKYPPKPLQKTLIQKKPEKPIGKRPQSPNKSLSPTRVLRRPEDVGETCEEEYSYKIKPSDNIQTVVETNHTTVSLTYPDRKSPKDFKPFVRNQEKPEEPSGRRPQPSNKNVSPTRSPKKLVENETLKSMVKTKPVISEIYPDKTKPQVYKSVDIDDDETVSSKFITNSTKKLIITEQEVEKIENSQYPDKKTLIDAKSGPKHSQESSFEPRQSTGKYCGPTHSPKEVKSPVRDQQRSNEKIIAKPFEKRPQSPSKPLSPTRSPKTTKDENTILETNEFVMKITNKQKAQKDMKTPRDSQSPVRYEQKPSQKYPEKPSGNRPQSPNKHVSPTRSPKQSVNIKTYKTFDNEEYPDEFKPRGRKPLDSDDEEAIVEASKLVINSTKKLIKNEQEFKQIEHLLTPEEKTPKEKPNQKYTEQPKTNLPKQFDTEVSPDRHLIPRKQKESKPLSNDQTEISSQTNDKHAEQKSTSVKPTNNDEDQTYIETNQIYINSKQKQVITDKDCLEHEKSKNKTAPNELTIDKRQKPTTQIQIVTKTKILQSNEPQYKESQKPVSEGSPSKEPESSKHVYNEPKSPKQVLPTRIRPTPKDEETFKTSLRPQKMITENTYKNITDVQTEKKTSNLYKPTDTDQNKHLTEKEDFPTNDLQISTKELKKASKKPQSPSIKVSPTQIEKVPETSVTETVTIKTCQKFSDEDYQEEQISSNKSNKPRDISSSSKQKEPERSHSPNKPTSPIRSKNKPDSKHSIDDSTFTSTLKNTTIIRDNSPSKTLKKPERSSSPGKSSSPTRAQKKPGEEKHPIDNKTFTNTLKNIRDNSPSKTLKKPERSPSPTRKQKKFGEDENYTTTKIVQEEVNQYVDDKNYPGKLTPTKPFEKLQTKPQEPIDTDEEETHKETRHFMTTSKTPKDFPIIPKHKPEQILLEDDNTSRKTLKRTDVVKEKVFATSDNKDLPEKEQPKKRSKSPQEDNLFTSDGDDNVRKPYYRSSPKPEPKYIKPGGEEKPRDNITFTGSTDFSRNASQQLITNERENTESDRKTPKRTENRSPSPCKERSPTHNASPTKPKEQRDKSDYLPSPESKTPKITTVEDQAFVKTLRSSTITEDLNVKNQKPSKDINDEETDAETEELFVETCQKSYVKTENISSTSIEKKPQDKKPETITGLTFPEDTEKLPETCANPEKPWNVPLVELNETERKETPDGAFISKTTDHSSPTSPTYRKKGTGRRDTFEERCRQILGMDTYGDTPGNYKQKPIPEIEETNRTETTKHETIEKDDLENKAIFQVKIEDCDEEDEPLYINNVKKTMHKQINTKEKTRTEPLKQKLEEPKKYTSQEPELEDMNEFMQTSTVPNKSPGSLTAKVPIGQTKKETPQELKFVDNDDNEFGHTVIRTTTVHKESDATKSLKQNPDKPTKNASQKSELEKEELNEFMQTSTAPDKSLKAQPPQQTEVEDNDIEYINKITKTTTKQTKSNETSSRKPEEHPKNKTPDASDLDDEDNEFMRTVTETITVHKKSTKHQPSVDIDEQSQPSEPETCISSKHIDKTLEKEYGIENKTVKITKMISPSSSPRSSSPTKKSTSPRTTSPTKQTIPTEEASKRKPSKDNMDSKISRKPSTQSETETTTIKDRLRSSTRKTKSPPKRDQVDGSDSSSPEHSPNRITERRRSSNISVNTEIIIEHTEMDTSSKKEKSPESKRPQDSVYREIIDSTVLPEKLIRRMPVTERKESAPVHRVTTKEKDSKMSRSTSENLIKVKKPEPRNNSPKASPRPVEHRSRPNKCFATKTINLSTSDRLVSSETMENVVIDIQQAKSSREPSPDKIVPTPVPAYLDTGKPRYPDVIQEPEDERPKRKPQVKNIPIFEEEQNAYVGCHITEIKVEKTESSYDSMDYNPLVEAPPSLDYNSLDTTNDDEESVLTVIEKVTKFQNIAEEMTKPKASEPFQRQYDDKAEIPQDDDCLLSVDEKRERFSKTMENVSKTNEVSQVTNKGTDEDELEDEDHKEFVRNERIYTAKLQPMAPQKSPELVRSISRHISRQNELDELNEQPQQQQQPHINEANKDYPLTNTNEDFVECFENQKKKHTKEFKVSHQQQQHHQSKKFTAEKKYQQQPKQNDNNDDDDNNIPNTDDEELIPLTARHTTIIEERRQKDILSRPSVFEGRNKKPTAATPLKCNKSPVKDTEKLRPDIKSRIQPTDSTTITSSSIKPRQTTQRTNKNTDNDYDELCGNNNKNNNNKTLETVVKSIIGKQTKLSSSSGNSSSDKTNDLKKQSTNKKSEKQNTTSVRLRPAQKTDDENVSADGIIISTTEQQVTVRNEEYLNKEKCEKTPVPKTITSQHSSTSSSPLQPLKFQTKEHNLEKLTDEVICLETNTNEIQLDEKTSDIDETVLEPSNKPLKHPHNKSPKMSTKTTTSSTTDSVAARRSLFENNNGGSGAATPTKRTPLASPMSGRRPSYMEHTKSSLEHTRRDSLEVNKNHYSRKSSQPEEEVITTERNTAVKFDVPSHNKRPSVQRPPSTNEDINVEEIFDLEVLEKLLETIQSYEIRRRVRAQIRLIRKNQKNELISNTVVTTKTSITKSGKPLTEEEEPDTTTKQPKTLKDNAPKQTSTKKEYIFEEAYHPPSRKSPTGKRYPYEKPEPEQHSPERVGEKVSVTSTTKKQYYYKDDYQQEEVKEISHETSHSRDSPTRKSSSTHSSPDRQTSPISKSPIRNQERSRSPQSKLYRVTSGSHSPDAKTSPSRRKSSTTTSSNTATNTTTTASATITGNKPLTKRVTTTTTTTTTTATNGDKTPVWADRKNILKAPGTTTPKKSSNTTTSSVDSRTGYTKSIKSLTTSQKLVTNKSSYVDDDCITSSYGIGPTDENGLPLFGIRALKKKKPQVEPSETTEEVTGYVVEEKYYADNKTKPIVERKEFIYSTNPEELQKLKEQVEVTSSAIKSIKDVDVKETHQATLISKSMVKGATPALRSSPEDDFLDTTTKYVRRGSVKEMSEKFIQKEAASTTLTEKSNNYPKAGLILRTNSRKNSRDNDQEGDNYETYKTTTRVQQHRSTVLDDSDGDEHEYEVEEVASRHSGRFITESESECDSIKTQREFKTVTRSFLNSQGEEKIITNVSDCLERMRNADNVVEEGDTAEDQEARALLNKFLGASIIMKGVESSLPASTSSSTNRQSKVITTKTTTNSRNLSGDNDDDNTAKHEIKNTRITKTIKSGSSSSPVTYTTCDIEEIWDEEILKELLEQAKSYEERRKIRSRLRELMADREETKKSPTGEKDATTSVPVSSADVPEEESSASEYEEIIEEVTDYSEAESDLDETKLTSEKVNAKDQNKKEEEKISCSALTAETEISSSVEKSIKEEVSETKTKSKIKTISETVTETEIVQTAKDTDDKSVTCEKGESLQGQVVVHDTEKPPHQNMLKEGNYSNQKLKSVQTNFSSKATSSESSSMHALNNIKNQKSTSSSTSSSTSQNPIVTVQTPGRIDSNALNKNSNSSSSLGGTSVVVGNDNPRQVDRLGVPQKEDSGTESGEDLRLIAAGLRDQLQIQSDSNIIEDVTCALSRLENSLNEGKDISIDSEKRKALLALVARLRAGLTSPEKLAEIAAAMSALDGGVDGLYGETSSPEADAHRSNRSRFNKRRNRVNRHTVGVSREELADARRYMEDMLIMSNNISQSTTPEANSANSNVPPQWYPIEKNASMGAILTDSSAPILQRPKQFVPDDNTAQKYTNKLTVYNGGKRRPLSGEYSVTFENPSEYKPEVSKPGNSSKEVSSRAKQNSSPEDNSKNSRFSNKKHLMKRANTIDLAKSHKYNSEFDTDSDAEDKGPYLGLKRAVQVSVKKRVQNVVPPFEPKTENDRKFLAFINKQSDKPGLGWTTSRSVSNWTNKFGSIKSTFEGGLTSKPPQAPYHVSTGKNYQSHKVYNQQSNTNSPAPVNSYISNQQIAQRLQQEAQRQAEEMRRQSERERNRLEYERREREKLERQRQQRERLERERLEREHFERQRREQDQITAAQHAAILREQEKQLAISQQNVNTMNVPKPLPINEFKHAPQSVFRPIDSIDAPAKPIYKPIPQLPKNFNNWQNQNTRPQADNSLNASPSQYGNTRPDDSFITSPPPSTRSPIGLPWASKPALNNSSFKTKANRFEEASKYDHIQSSGPYVQRHNSLRSSNGNANHINEDFKKRPSLPNTFDPYNMKQTPLPQQQNPLAYLPPPQNISFTYTNLKPKTNYQSYPCLPLAVDYNSNDSIYQRSREDSLTNPHSMPLVLTSENPSYGPTAPTPAAPQEQQHLSQLRMAKQFDLVSPVDSTPTSPSVYTVQQTDCTDDDLDSDNNLLEYHAVSRVMGKPQCQTAVRVGRRTGHVSDDELYGKNSRAAKNLLNTMKNIGNTGGGSSKPKQTVMKRPEKITSPKLCLSPDGRSYQAPVVDPLFPEVTKFETNRKPVYIDQEANQNVNTPHQIAAPAPRKQIGVYKSMENLNRNINSGSFTQQSSPKPYVNQTSPTTSNFATKTQQPTYQALTQPMYTTSTQQSSTKPYISQTQTSYVVTYPIDDNTDDEDFSRQSSKTVQPPRTLDLRRQRNVSETSTASSTTASVSYSNNLLSPNTNWTSNPIIANESSNYQATNPKNLQQPTHTEPTYQALNTQMTTNYTNTNSVVNRGAPSGDHTQKTNRQYETLAAETKSVPSAKPSYDAQPQIQVQLQQTTNHNQTSKTTNEAQKYTVPQKQEENQKPVISQKPTMQPTKISMASTVSQEKKTITSMRKTLSEDHHHHNIMRDQTVLNPQHSNISQEMLERLDQQRERISNETRRKSLGNALDYQMEKQARYETQQQIQQQQYKSSAPPDTPDIVKSSLPKDENQPILKKFGPPQRHHYMPNSYQSPTVNSVTSARTVASSTTSLTTKTQNKNLQQTTATNKSVLKTTAHKLVTNTKPTVVETPATPQPNDDYIPRNIVYNNIHAFSSMARRQDDENLTGTQEIQQQIRPNKLSKSDSWNQIVMLQNQNNQRHSPKFNQSPTNELRRTKSGHTLALPKMYEAAMTKTDITEKQKTVAAYFSGQKSPTQNEMVIEQQQQQTTTATKRSVINRIKTSEKVSAASRKSLGYNLPIAPGGLTRSATMPHIANLNLLDESNVEDAFEQLIMDQKQNLSSSTTEKTETKEKDGAVVTTTTKVTTRTVTGTAAKPVSAFNKFKQLDSQQSAKSPTTPTTPGGGNSTASPTSTGGNQPIFKFTDPALNARAATVKDQLLQWCQTKTQEYENVQITNFSTSWNNGLAFCALIHHFLPDAFDYSQLTPKNRRKNFELAFTVADEKAGIAPLLDVEDMVVMQRPDWKCVFVYVQSIYRRFRNCQ